MTDLIVELENGERVHQYMNDGKSAIIYIRPHGTMTVREMGVSTDYNIKRLLTKI